MDFTDKNAAKAVLLSSARLRLTEAARFVTDADISAPMTRVIIGLIMAADTGIADHLEGCDSGTE